MQRAFPKWVDQSGSSTLPLGSWRSYTRRRSVATYNLFIHIYHAHIHCALNEKQQNVFYIQLCTNMCQCTKFVTVNLNQRCWNWRRRSSNHNWFKRISMFWTSCNTVASFKYLINKRIKKTTELGAWTWACNCYINKKRF